ncbi:UDP-glucose 4-epimerase GalE [Serratia fonticola]|nr:UDP-glucose 4-epimerase GalE [Serratia fonticola]
MTSPYDISKLMFEQMLHDLAKAEPQFSIIAFRNFNPVGAHESGLIGEEPNGILDKLLLYIA